MSRARPVGFDRRIELEWLDFVAARVAEGMGVVEVRDACFERLFGVTETTKRRMFQKHAVTVLSRVWAAVPPACEGLRGRALGCLSELEDAGRVPIHWALALGAYPFFGEVASNVGRLLELQGAFSTGQLARRMRESWGERSTVQRATPNVVRSMARWGCLVDQPKKSFARAGEPAAVRGPVAELLLEALLIGQGGRGMAIDQVARHPALFPFDVQVLAADLRNAPQFEVHRQGLDLDIVGLADGDLGVPGSQAGSSVTVPD